MDWGDAFGQDCWASGEDAQLLPVGGKGPAAEHEAGKVRVRDGVEGVDAQLLTM
jgi:hypothetical protein